MQAPPSSSLALECLVFLASLRRSLFSSEEERHGQSGRLGGAIAGHQGLVRLHLKASDCPPHS